MITIKKASPNDLDELENLYNEVCDYLQCHINYPGWKKGIYPARDTAEDAIEENNLFVVRLDGTLAGTFILRHRPEEGYKLADWKNDFDYNDIFVIYTLAVHPQFKGLNLGTKIMDFIAEYAKINNVKAIRLDVCKGNEPAIHLYRSCGYTYIDTVDLGYGDYGLDWFELYQKVID